MKDKYVLRSHDLDEISRLEFQHRVWKQETDRVVRKAGFKAGDHLLDLGCGPGFLTFDLAALVGTAGSVLAIDNSNHFIDHLHREAKSRQLPGIDGVVGDVSEFPFQEGSLDGAICRWVLMFVPHAEQALANVAKALRPGATIAILEYVHFRSISLWPQGAAFKRVYDAVYELILKAGGDPDIGGRIPKLLEGVGFQIAELVPILRVGRPGTPLWDWLDATRKNQEDLVQKNLVTSSELKAYHQEWLSSSQNPSAFFTAPPVLATIAKKR